MQKIPQPWHKISTLRTPMPIIPNHHVAYSTQVVLSSITDGHTSRHRPLSTPEPFDSMMYSDKHVNSNAALAILCIASMGIHSTQVHLNRVWKPKPLACTLKYTLGKGLREKCDLNCVPLLKSVNPLGPQRYESKPAVVLRKQHI